LRYRDAITQIKADAEAKRRAAQVVSMGTMGDGVEVEFDTHKRLMTFRYMVKDGQKEYPRQEDVFVDAVTRIESFGNDVRIVSGTDGLMAEEEGLMSVIPAPIALVANVIAAARKRPVPLVS
jgi:3-dehydroquinate synthase class II